MTHAAASARSVDLHEQETELQLATHRAGVLLTLMVGVAGSVFVAATWGDENRGVILAVALAAIASAAAVSALPAERIVRSRWWEPFFAVWASAESLLIAVAVLADGGVGSPLVLLFTLPLLFGALAYRLPTTALVGAIDVAAFLAVASLAGNSPALAIFGAFCLVCVAVMSAWGSNSQANRRHVMAETANALAVSERHSRRQARQQAAVAALGARALEGDEIGQLMREVAGALRVGLGVSHSAVLRLDPERRVLVDDTPRHGQPGAGQAPHGIDSHAGYVVATGSPVIVGDWGSEERFSKAPSQIEAGIVGGIAVPITAGRELFGVLAADSTSKREYSGEDLNFMQALANVLGSAVARRAEEERTRHDALHDPLTGLANRTLFRERLGRALQHADRYGHKVAVLFLDLDDFKRVNDSLGHATGDELLAAIAPRLQRAVRASDALARFGGDEFAILLGEISELSEAMQAARRITEELTRPFDLEYQHYVSASIGIAVGDGAAEPDALLRDSDAALYEAKRRGRGSVQLFGAETRKRVLAHLQVEAGLRHAADRGELELDYQPVINLADRSIVGVEALLRWRDPERGLLSPDEFIPVAEETGLIEPIGRWVIETACGQAARWHAMAPDAPPLGIGVNFSARQLAGGQAATVVAAAIEKSGIDPTALRIELTESTLVESWDVVSPEVAALKHLGVKLVLDDFGRGYSSLTYLTRLPLDSVKLDRGFVEDLEDGSRHVPVVKAVIEIGEELGFSVVAEGIETAQQLAVVDGLGCGYAQGFYFARPAPAAKVDEWLQLSQVDGARPMAKAARFAWEGDPRRRGGDAEDLPATRLPLS